MNYCPLTILLPVYNTMGRLEHCLRALSHQSSYNFKLVIHDNCSNDGSSDLIENFIQNHKALFFIDYHKHDENLGAALNWVSLIHKIDSEYFLFLDSEDIISRDYVLNFSNLIIINSYDVIFPEFYELDDNGNKRLMLAPQRASKAVKHFRLPLLSAMSNTSGIGYIAYSIYNSSIFKTIFLKIFELESIKPSKYKSLDISLAFYVALFAKNIGLLDDTKLFHYSKIIIDATRLQYNEIGYEDFIAATPSIIFEETISVLSELNLMPDLIIQHLSAIVQTREKLNILQRSLSNIILKFTLNNDKFD